MERKRQQRQKQPYRIFRPTYTDKVSGERRHSPTYNIAFRDHHKCRKTIAGHEDEERTRRIAVRIIELVDGHSSLVGWCLAE